MKGKVEESVGYHTTHPRAKQGRELHDSRVFEVRVLSCAA
jgi:hypothetical protein